ncbi:MAG TPA: hypothetical protein VFM31_06300 [Nitrososphaeraceae archaeon]|jgi:hypothetical protein|nr:hypothetical protein [Nitrososphaeraceae archaeon]
MTLNLFFISIDIVGSSNPAIPIDIQAEKIRKVLELVKKNSEYPKVTFESFTGDGVLLSFEDPRSTLELAQSLHKELNSYNKLYKNEKRKQIEIKIGISYGNCIKLFQNDPSHPWGREMVLSKRIVDIANSGNILLSSAAYKNISQYNSSYYENLEAIGLYEFKHKEKDIIYIYYDKKNGTFGNNIRPIDRSKSFRNKLLRITFSITEESLIHIKREHIIENISCGPQELKKHYLPQNATNVKLYDDDNKEMRFMPFPPNLTNKIFNEIECLTYFSPMLDEGEFKKYTFEFDIDNSKRYNQLFTYDCDRFEAIFNYPHHLNSSIVEYAEILDNDNNVIERIQPKLIYENRSISRVDYNQENIYSSKILSISFKW